jgi:hypothetical protein
MKHTTFLKLVQLHPAALAIGSLDKPVARKYFVRVGISYSSHATDQLCGQGSYSHHPSRVVDDI